MNNTSEATSIVAPLWKRKWLIIAVGILVAGGTYAYYERKSPIFLTSTQLYLGNGSEEQGLLNGGSGGKRVNVPEGPNQTALINSPLVHEVVVRTLRSQNTPVAKAALRGKARAKSGEKSEFITISAEAHTPAAAALLANTTAATYISRENGNFERDVRASIALTRRQLRRIEAGSSQPTKGGKGSSAPSSAATLQAATLSTKINQLEADLSIAGVKQIGLAKPTNAQLLSPLPKKNAIFGFVLGLFLACVAAYALSRFDRRLRSLESIEEAFHAHILTALPSVRRPIVRRDGQLTPSRMLSEPLRRLHTTLQMGELPGRERGGPARSILFLSPDAGDGKSTIIATLALVQREAGQRAAVIEADFRRPVQGKLLDVVGPQGLAEALSGALALDEAMQAAGSPAQEASANSAGSSASVATMVESRSTGSLSVLVGRTDVDNPPALLADQRMGGLLESLTQDYDRVLIDAPSPLQVSDVLPLLPQVDGIVLVARVGHTREVSAQRLMQLLARTPGAPILGVVANDVSRADLEQYGFPSTSGVRRWPSSLIRR